MIYLIYDKEIILFISVYGLTVSGSDIKYKQFVNGDDFAELSNITLNLLDRILSRKIKS